MARQRELTLVLRARNALQRGLSSAGRQLRAFGQSAARIGRLFARSFLAAGAALAGFAVKAVHSFAQQEKAERALAASLAAYGEQAEAILPSLRRVADAIQDQTAVSDDQVLAGMAVMRMLGVQTDQLEQAAKGVLALTQIGMGHEQAQRAMALAMQGNFQMLTRYVPALRDATTEQEKAAIVNDLLARGYNSQRDQLDTVAGQWQLLRGRVGDAWEEIGRAISQNDTLMEALQRAGEAVRRFTGRITEWAEGGGMVNLIAAVRHFANEFALRWNMIGNTAAIVFAAIGDGAETWHNYFTGVIRSTVTLAIRHFQRMGAAGAAAFQAMRRPSRAALRELRDMVARHARESVEDLRNVASSIAGADTAVTRRTEAQLEQREAYQREHAERVARINAWHQRELARQGEARVEREARELEDILGEREAALRALAARETATAEEIEKERARIAEQGARERIGAMEDELRARERIAQQTVRSYIDEVRQQRRAARQWERDQQRAADLQQRQARGVRLTRGQAEFLGAVQAVAGARRDVAAMPGRLAEAQRQLDEMTRQTRTLDDMLRDLHAIREQQAELLAAG